MPTNLTVQCINLLRATHNLILHGAPGTGKTHLAKEIVKALEAEAEFVQFHPSYDYTDFVEGLRPVKHIRENEIGFERRDGVFKAFCKKALDAREVEEKRFEEVTLKRISQSAHIHMKKDGESQFDIIYKSIVDDIRSGKITHYKTPTAQQYLDIKNGRILFRANTNTARTENEKNFSLLYHYFIKNNRYDLSDITQPEWFQLITQVTNGGTKTIDYVEYGWLLQEMLNRTSSFSTSDGNVAKANPSTQTNTTTSISVVTTNKIIKQPYIIIIDEINRGEISKIFGELFFAIESGYRGDKHKINTQYQNLVSDDDIFRDGFFVPENVYIIGTMNDIDRSVEPIDFAFRRRFSWKEIKAEDTQDDILQMLDSGLQIEAKQRMDKLNSAILQTEGLSSAYQIGAAYFLKLSDLHGDFEKLWEYHLRDLLVEYLRGHSEAETKLKRLENAYKLQQTNFADDVDDE